MGAAHISSTCPFETFSDFSNMDPANDAFYGNHDITDIYLFRVNNRKTGIRCQICSKLTHKFTSITSLMSF